MTAVSQSKQRRLHWPHIPTEWASRPVRASLLGDPVYLNFWLSRLLSQTAQGAILYALLILITDRTDQSIYTSLFVICAIVPALIFGLPAGISVDSLPRVPLMVVLNFLRVLFVMALVDASLSMIGIFAVALGLWTIHQFYAPAESALMASLVDRQLYTHAQSLSNLALSLAQFLGLVLIAPVVLRVAGPPALFTLCGMLWIGAAILVGLLPSARHAGALNRKSAQVLARACLTAGISCARITRSMRFSSTTCWSGSAAARWWC